MRYISPFTNLEAPPGLDLATNALHYINYFNKGDNKLVIRITPIVRVLNKETRHGYLIKRKGIKMEFCLLTFMRHERETIGLFNYTDWNSLNTLRSNPPLVLSHYPKHAGFRIVERLTPKSYFNSLK